MSASRSSAPAPAVSVSAVFCIPEKHCFRFLLHCCQSDSFPVSRHYGMYDPEYSAICPAVLFWKEMMHFAAYRLQYASEKHFVQMRICLSSYSLQMHISLSAIRFPVFSHFLEHYTCKTPYFQSAVTLLSRPDFSVSYILQKHDCQSGAPPPIS